MDEKKRRKYNVTPPLTKPLERTKAQRRYFYLNGKLYKVLREVRASDLLVAWDFADGKAVQFVLSDSKRRMRPAYDTKEVARLLNRSRVAIQNHVVNRNINTPVKIAQKGDSTFSIMKWSEEDIIALHEYLLTAGGGPARKDGTLYPAPRLPTRKELLALLREQPMFYMRTASGELVPVWSAYNEI